MKNESITLPLRNSAGTITVQVAAIKRISRAEPGEVCLELLPNGIVWCEAPDTELAGIYRRLAASLDTKEREAQEAASKIS